MEVTCVPQHIGILGGMGPQATLAFLSHVLTEAREVYGAKRDAEYPRLSVESIALPGFTAHELPEQSAARTTIQGALERLAVSGATAIAIPCNTVHLFFDSLASNVCVPLIDMVAETVQECVQTGASHTYLLATRMTCEAQLYQTAAAGTALTITTPSAEAQELIEDLITLLEEGRTDARVQTLFLAIQNEALTQNVDTIILGCTELSLLPLPTLQLRIIDSSRVLAKRIVAHAYGAAIPVPLDEAATQRTAQELPLPEAAQDAANR